MLPAELAAAPAGTVLLKWWPQRPNTRALYPVEIIPRPRQEKHRIEFVWSDSEMFGHPASDVDGLPDI